MVRRARFPILKDKDKGDLAKVRQQSSKSFENALGAFIWEGEIEAGAEIAIDHNLGIKDPLFFVAEPLSNGNIIESKDSDNTANTTFVKNEISNTPFRGRIVFVPHEAGPSTAPPDSEAGALTFKRRVVEETLTSGNTPSHGDYLKYQGLFTPHGWYPVTPSGSDFADVVTTVGYFSTSATYHTSTTRTTLTSVALPIGSLLDGSQYRGLMVVWYGSFKNAVGGGPAENLDIYLNFAEAGTAGTDVASYTTSIANGTNQGDVVLQSWCIAKGNETNQNWHTILTLSDATRTPGVLTTPTDHVSGRYGNCVEDTGSVVTDINIDVDWDTSNANLVVYSLGGYVLIV